MVLDLWLVSPQFGTVLERVRTCDLAGGSTPLGIGFESVKIYTISHLLWVKVGALGFCFTCHPCLLPWFCVVIVMNSYPFGTISPR